MVGDVSVQAVGEERFRGVAGDDSQEVEGFEQARQRAHEPAGN
jgi:hypothetical protein